MDGFSNFKKVFHPKFGPQSIENVKKGPVLSVPAVPSVPDFSIHLLKSRTFGTPGMLEQGLILTFYMDWGKNFGWNTFLKFENPFTGSKVS